jgi:hypothetical protein
VSSGEKVAEEERLECKHDNLLKSLVPDMYGKDVFLCTDCSKTLVAVSA